jgi:hypothetical protein
MNGASFGSLFGSSGVDHLFDHAIRVWRPVRSRGAHREQIQALEPVIEPDGLNARVSSPTGLLADTGPGLTMVGERKVYMNTSLDVQKRDILELVSGPNAPATLEVDGPPHRPRGHHLELRCREWTGKLPETGVES